MRLKNTFKFLVQVLLSAALIMTVGLSDMSRAQPAPGGSLIENQARISYFNELLGIYESIPTNTVITVVNEVPAIEVVEDRVTYLTPNTAGEFAYFVRNTGNTPLEVTLALTQQTGDDYDLANVSIYVDLNGNGIVDPGDVPITSGSAYPIEVGGELGVIVQFATPAALQDGDAALIDLVAADAGNTVSDAVTGTVFISTTGLALQKEVNLAEASPGDTLRYTLELRNRGTNDVPAYTQIDGETIRIDGTSALPGILVRDSVPLNTTFSQVVTFNETQGFDLLYHVAGASISNHDYFTALPAGSTLADVDAIAFFREGDYPVSYSSDFVFEVTIAENIANTYIPNTAETWQDTGNGIEEIESNPVRTRVRGVPGEMTYTDLDGNPIISTGLDTEVRLYLTASACNRDASVIDGADPNNPIIVTIVTSPEGDFERILMKETGPNTGIFENWAILTPDGIVERVGIQVQNANQNPVVQENALLSGYRATQAPASIVCGGETITADLEINPGGYVFNSASNDPVMGAELILYDSLGNVVETTFSEVDGFYSFNELLSGTYRIEVRPQTASDVVFPSARTLFTDWDRNINLLASYGQFISVSDDVTTPFFGIDIPLDPDTSNALILEKGVEPDVVVPGSIVAYNLVLENRLDIAVANTTIYDDMPEGLTYIDGSARARGEPVDVSVGSDGVLVFDVGDLFRQEEIVITYAATVDPLASGRLVNTAYASGQYYGDGPVRSNDARATLRVDRDTGVFRDSTVILGTVYVDFNGNGIQDEFIGPLDASTEAQGRRADEEALNGQNVVPDGTLGPKYTGKATPPAIGPQPEPGIPGVRIYFSNGAYVVTDANGRYSIPGMSSRPHAAAVSERTLPKSVEMSLSTTREAGDSQSRMIHSLPGQLQGEYFATIPHDGMSDADVLLELAERRTAFLESGGGDVITPQPDGAGAPQSTELFGSNRSSSAAASTPQTSLFRPSTDVALEYQLPPEAQTATLLNLARTRNLEVLVPQLSPDLGFVDLSSDVTLSDDVVTIRIKGPIAGRLGLLVNGEAVGVEKISQRVAFAGNATQAVEYVAVRLQSGANTLTVTYADPFGNIRDRREIRVNAPGDSAQIEVIAPPVAYASPATPIPVVLRITDAAGVPTGISMDVTLEAVNGGRWGARDVRPSEPGHQVFVDNGEALLDYYPPNVVGTHRIRVRNGMGSFATDIILEPDASERIIIGYVEGVIGLSEDNIDTDNLIGYDETITGINGELYLRGRILGETILTLRYNSDEDSTERLFRDVNPLAYYPVYGDASQRGYDAQSNSQLYVRVERGTNYILYGDIQMAPQSDAIQLGSYSRTLTGVHAHWQDGPVRVDIMAGRTDRSQVIREFRAEGVAGPYDLDLGDYLDGSETVEIITRDLRQPGTILSTLTLQRYVDYRLDFFNDSIIFDAAVTATDENGNPNFIRVSYESIDGADDYWLYSAEVRYAINDQIAAGYREIRSEAEPLYTDRRTVRSAYVEAQINESSDVVVELAQSIDHIDDDASAGRVAYNYRENDLAVTVTAARAEENFLSAGAGLSAGREEVAAEATWKIQPGLEAVGGLYYDHRLDTGDQRYGVEALLDYTLRPDLNVSGGLRYLERQPGDGRPAQTVPSGVLGARYTPSSRLGFSLGAELEVDLSNAERLRLSLSAADQLTDRLRLTSELTYATEDAEFLDFSTGAGGISQFKAGIDYHLTDSVAAFSSLQSGARTGVSAGVSGEWGLDESGWASWFPAQENSTAYLRAEHFMPYDVDVLLGLPFGNTPVDSDMQTSLAFGAFGAYNEGQGVLRLDTEASLFDDGYSLYARQYWAQNAGDWTVGVENRLAYSERDSTGQRLRNHLRIGGAYRSALEVLDLLTYAGYRIDDDPQGDLSSRTGYWTADGSWAVNADTRLTFRQAGQYTQQTVAGFDAETFLTLGQLGFDRDFQIGNETKARFSGHALAFYDVYSEEVQPAYGVELGVVPLKNVILSAGYNWSDIEAAEVSEIYHTGAFLKFNVTLDNNLWALFER